ncbi:hypothetical protein D7Y27_28310 [Corallococcus sp. AB004]|nr:hypothetical protein D7Y27_28310 [Corallococcus sp. AB004]
MDVDNERADEFLPQLLIELGQQRAQLLALRLAPSPGSGLPIAAQAVVPSPNAATANPAAPLLPVRQLWPPRQRQTSIHALKKLRLEPWR